jgi:hypothetical protein
MNERYTNDKIHPVFLADFKMYNLRSVDLLSLLIKTYARNTTIGIDENTSNSVSENGTSDVKKEIGAQIHLNIVEEKRNSTTLGNNAMTLCNEKAHKAGKIKVKFKIALHTLALISDNFFEFSVLLIIF